MITRYSTVKEEFTLYIRNRPQMSPTEHNETNIIYIIENKIALLNAIIAVHFGADGPSIKI